MFEEDVVEAVVPTKKYSRENQNKPKLGVVLESSRYFTSDEDDDVDIFKEIHKDSVRVAWHPTGKTEIVKEEKLKLVDRSLVPGDVVRRMIQGHESQKGYVFKTRITCVLRCLNQPFIVSNVDSSSLQPLLRFNGDSHDVYMDDWVGVVKKVSDRVVVKFKDGARCELNSEEAQNLFYEFDDLNDKKNRDSEFATGMCYVGQVLKGPLSAFQNAKWFLSTKHFCQKTAKKSKSKQVVVVVEEFDVQSVEVFWLCRGYSGADASKNISRHPPTIVTGKDLERLQSLDCFAASNYQIGDEAYYVLDSGDEIVSIEDVKKKDDIIRNCIMKCREKSFVAEKPVEICRDQSSRLPSQVSSGNVDSILSLDNISIGDSLEASENLSAFLESEIGLQDNEEACQDESDVTRPMTVSTACNLRKYKYHKPSSSTRNQRKKKVFLKKTKPKKFYEQTKKFEAGDKIPVEIVSTFTVVDVVWQDGQLETNIHSTSLYPIHHLDELEFFPGDFVVHSQTNGCDSSKTYGIIQKMNFSARTCDVRWFNSNSEPCEGNEEIDKDVSVFDLKEHGDLNVRPGLVAVRVGGFSDNKGSEKMDAVGGDLALTAVGGQILELGVDGRLLIQWADQSTSFCKPLDLFFVGLDMSDVEESEDEYEYEPNDDSDSDSSESSESCQWETEEEIEMSTTDDGKFKSPRQSKLSKAEEVWNLENMNRNYEFFVSSAKVLKTYQKSLTEILERIKKLIEDESNPVEEDSLASQNITTPPVTSPATSLSATSASFSAVDSNMMPTSSGCKASSVTATTTLSSTSSLTSASHKIAQPLSLSIPSADLEQCFLEAFSQADQPTQGSLQVPDYFSSSVDDFMVVVLELQTLYRTFCRLENVKKINCMSRLKKYFEMANDKMESERIKDWSSRAIHKAKCLYEMNCKRENSQNDNLLICENQKTKQENEKLAPEKFADYPKPSSASPPVDASTKTSLRHQVRAKACEFIKDFQSLLTELLVEFESKEAYYKKRLHKKEDEKIECTDDVASKMTDDEEDDLSHINLMKLLLDVDKANDSFEDAEKEVESIFEEEFFSCPSGDLSPLTPEVNQKIKFNEKGFAMLSSSPDHHHFKSSSHNPSNQKIFLNAVKKEINLLKGSLPMGIFVKGYDSRMDLFSVMIEGPTHTPYEDGLFFFDVQLPPDYPKNPPKFFYISYCVDRLNPNLYEDGKVCVSLLGTWLGKGTEVWNPKESNLLQVLVSIQGLILNNEPYFNEAGYERQKGTQEGHENSRMYNEMVLIKLVQAMTKLLRNPHVAFAEEIDCHFRERSSKFITRFKSWLQDATNDQRPRPVQLETHLPKFPLYPMSKGFLLSLTKSLNEFILLVASKNIYSDTTI